MKRVLVTFVFVCSWFMANAVDFNYELTGSNQSVLITSSVAVSGILEDGSIIGVFYVDNTGELQCAGSGIWDSNQALGIAVWGTVANEDNGFEEDEELRWYVQKLDGSIAALEVLYGDGLSNTYQTNSFRWISEIAVVDSEGCTDENYLEYTPYATLDNGSCSTVVVYGCLDSNSPFYNPLANTADNSCNSMAIYGCTQAQFYEYNEWATVDDGSCTVYWQALYYDSVWELENMEENLVTSQSQLNTITSQYEELLIQLSAVQEELAIAEQNIEVVNLQVAQLQSQTEELNTLNIELQSALDLQEVELEEMQMNFEEPISINLLEGWNMIGFTRRTPMDVGALFADEIDNIILIKDNSANMFWPEFGFNGIGNLEPGHGYQVKTNAAINNYSFPYVPGERLEMSPTVPDWAFEMAVNHPNDKRELVRKVNLVGQEIEEATHLPGEIILLLYSDGSVEKVIY